MKQAAPGDSSSQYLAVQVDSDPIQEIDVSIDRNSQYYNEDLAPVPVEKRTWNLWNFAALWVGMSVCIPTYMLAAGMMKSGMMWWQALLTITLGNIIILIPMMLNAHAGTKYGIPFPVLLRSSFGVVGSNIPAMMRALVACGWFGIQTWIGGSAIFVLLCAMMGWDAKTFTPIAGLGISGTQFACFMLFWAINILIIVRGIDSIKWLENWAAPFLIVMGLALLAWGVSTAGGFDKIFATTTVAKVRGSVKNFSFWSIFFPSLTAMVGFWATLALNIPDFTRHARSQRDQMMGQAIGLPTTMALFSFIGITVTAATVVIFGEAVWDPIALIAKFKSPVAVGLSMFALSIATLSTNIAANVVSPANDFANLNPKKISFRTGGIITGVIGIVIMPWRLMSDMGAYIFTWLIGYGALLGAIGGVMLADYYILRKMQLKTEDLYTLNGEYSFGGSGFNWRAITALFVGIAPNVPGFLQAASKGSIQVPTFFNSLYVYAWFVSLFIAGITYLLLNTLSPAKK